MATREKGKSPFHPGQPVPPELFVGRKEQMERVLRRGAAQVAAGKPVSMYVQGEYGIGKSSIANYVQRAAEQEYKLLRVYVNLGGAESIDDFAERVLEAVVRSGGRNQSASEKLKNWLGKYVGKQQLFGFSINLEALKADVPGLTTPGQMLEFLRETLARMGDSANGVFLALDELNGIVNNPQFAHFVKGLVEENAMANPPLPLLLMLCGVEERRRTMIHHHPPVDRIFDVVEIEKMTEGEMTEFFQRSFREADIQITPEAMKAFTRYSAGFPKIMHVIGDEAYFLDSDGVIDQSEAMIAVVRAADEVGRKFVDQQVYRALKSPDYHSILQKIASHGPTGDGFKKRDIEAGLTTAEKNKFGNFLQRMKKLNVLRSGDAAGDYVFNLQMVRLYIWLESLNRPNHVATEGAKLGSPKLPSGAKAKPVSEIPSGPAPPDASS